MPVTGVVPDWLFSTVAVATIFSVMFSIGLATAPGEFRALARHPGLMARGLFCVLVAVPALAWIVARAFALPRSAEIGIMLMAISPGAPVALRRSLGAGGDRAFAPALQIAVAALAVVSMPLSIAALNEYYAGTASIDPQVVGRQVFTAQFLPLLCGMLARHFGSAGAAWLEPRLRRVAGVLLIVLLVLALIDIWEVVIGAGMRVTLAIITVTALAVTTGHLLGGPAPATRTATGISSAARNPGLALLVATLNAAAPAVQATILSYLVIASLTLIPYVFWRRRRAPPAPGGG